MNCGATTAAAATFRSILDKPLNLLTEDDISQLTREDCRRFLKEKGMRRPSWNKSQAIQQVISLKALLEPSDDDAPPPPPSSAMHHHHNQHQPQPQANLRTEPPPKAPLVAEEPPFHAADELHKSVSVSSGEKEIPTETNDTNTNTNLASPRLGEDG